MTPDRAITRRTLLAASMLTLAAGCGAGRSSAPAAGPTATPTSPPAVMPPTAPPVTTDPAVLASRATVPVLCWHQLRDWESSDTRYNRRYLICPPAKFRAQLDALVQAGHTTITPDQYLTHLQTGTGLPPKPVLLTFDDGQASQMSVGFPELQRRRMLGTFFVMTVVLDKRNWMSRRDLRTLDAAGMTVAAHSYDHNQADQYSGTDWRTQFDDPRAELSGIIGKPVRHLAYPYGAWDRECFPHVREAGYTTAFQLSDQPMDPTEPVLTLRRILVDSYWTGPELLEAMAKQR